MSKSITTVSQRKEIVRRVLELHGDTLRAVIDSKKAELKLHTTTDAIVREIMKWLSKKQ